MRALKATLRRHRVLVLVGEFGWGYGVQVRIVARIGVSEATVSRDLARLLPLYWECPACGSLVPWDGWLDD
jgi:hypothetical protein